MTPELESICKEIGQYIAATVPGEWTQAWIDIAFDPGVISAEGTYVDERNAVHSFTVTGAVARLFARLRQLAKRDDQSLWASAKFLLRASGDFHIDFEY